MTREFGQVYTMTDYYDGPREGVADFRGAPHVYRSIYLDTPDWDPDEDRFQLSPISVDVLALALEDWAIWQRFDAARRAGGLAEPADEDSWGFLPDDAARHAEITRVLGPALQIDPARCLIARGTFRVVEPDKQLEVSWRPVE
jgi:hypothetical protein